MVQDSDVGADLAEPAPLQPLLHFDEAAACIALTCCPRPVYAAGQARAHLEDFPALQQLDRTGVRAVLVGANAQLPLRAAPPHEDDVGGAPRLLHGWHATQVSSLGPTGASMRQADAPQGGALMQVCSKVMRCVAGRNSPVQGLTEQQLRRRCWVLSSLGCQLKPARFAGSWW